MKGINFSELKPLTVWNLFGVVANVLDCDIIVS